MKIKKLIAFFIVSILIVSAFVGCTENKPSNVDQSNQSTSSDSGESKTEPKLSFTRDENGIPNFGGQTIKIWLAPNPLEIKWIQNYSEYDSVKAVQEQMNVKFEFTHPPAGQEKDVYSIMINSGDWGDIIWNGTESYYPGKLNMAMADKIMMPVDEYIGDVYTPNFNRVIMSNDSYRKLFVNDEGKVIRLGGTLITTEGDYGASCYIGPLIRKDMLAKANMETPETIEDWYNMLTSFKKNGVTVPYGWASKGWDITLASNTFNSAYGVNNKYMIDENGKVQFSPIQPGYKEYLTEMNKWFNEGLINPDFANQSDGDNMYPMLASDKIGAFTSHIATYSQVYYASTAKDNPDKDLTPAPFPILKKGDKPSRFRDAYYGVSGDRIVTTKAKDPGACVALLDSLYNPEIFYTLSGTEGVTFKRGTAGEYSIEPIWFPNDNELDMWKKHAPWIFKGGIDDNAAVPFYYGLPTQQAAFAAWNKAGYDGNIPNGITLTEEENAIVSKYETDIMTFVEEMRMKFMAGADPLTNFDSYVDQIKKMKIDEIVAAYQAAVDRFNAR